MGQKSEPEDFVTNLDEAKQVQRHKLIIQIIRLLSFSVTACFFVIVTFAVFMGYKNNQGPTFDAIGTMFSSITSVLGTALGVN